MTPQTNTNTTIHVKDAPSAHLGGDNAAQSGGVSSSSPSSVLSYQQSLSESEGSPSGANFGSGFVHTSSAAEPNSRNIFVRLLSRADVVLALLLVFGAFGLFWSLSREGGDTGPTAQSIFDQYGTVSLPLEDFALDDGGVNFADQQVIVNGSLHTNGSVTINNDLVLAPQAQPIDPLAGQIYYDQTSNVLSYYNGAAFVNLVGGVNSIEGAGGITVADDGNGNITLTGTGAGATGVTSFQGQTGAVSLTQGNGIDISGTTISNTGVVSLVSTNSTLVVTDDGGGNYELTVDIGGAGVISLNTLSGALNVQGTANQVSVSDNGSDTITLSTPQDIATSSSPAFSNLTLQGGTATLGTTSQQGSLVLHDGNGQTTTLQAGNSGGDLTFILPTDTGSQWQCLKRSATTQLIWDACDGGGGGNSTDLQDAYENGNSIVATDAEGDIDLTVSGATNFSVDITGTGSFLVQDGGTDLLTVADGGAIALQSGSSAITIGGGTQTGSVQVGTGTGVQTINLGTGGTGAKTVTLGSTASTSTTTLQAGSGGIILGTLSAADNDNVLCRNGLNQLATCSSTFATGSGQAFLQGGNSFTGIATLGTNDAFALEIETGGATRLTIAADGANMTLASDTDLLLQGAAAYISNPQADNNSESFGLNANSTDDDQVVIGNGATGGGDRSTVIGRLGNSTQVSCIDSVMIGYNTQCVNNNAIAIGSGASSSGGVAIGLNSGASTSNAVVVGHSSSAGSGSVILGSSVTNGGSNSVVVGRAAGSNTGGVAVGQGAAVNTNNSIAIGLGATVGTNANDTIVIGEGATASGSAQSNHLVVGGTNMSIQQVFIGNGITSSTPSNVTFNATGAATGQTNLQGANINIAGGRSTGNANGGNITFQVSAPGGSGTSQNSLSTVATLSGADGSLTLQNAIDSTTAFEVLNQAGTVAVLSVDTSTPGVVISGSGTDGSEGRLTFGTGIAAPYITREAAAFFGPDPDVLTLESDAIQFTNSGTTFFQLEGFNGRFTFRNGHDSFGFLRYVDTNDNVLFGVNDANGTGEATFMNHTDSTLAFRILDASTSTLFNVDTTNSRVEIVNAAFNAQGTVQFTGLGDLSGGTLEGALCLDTNGVVRVNGGGGTDCTTSSARYKDNIQTMQEEMGLDVISALRPVTFAYKNGGGSTEVGLIAEEVHEVLPEAVNYDENGLPNSVKYGMLTANLIKAIQQQQVQINDLRQGVLSGGLVEITGHIRVGDDTAGTVTIPAGQTSVHVVFNQSYETPPVVTLGAYDFTPVRLNEVITTGFTLVIPSPAPNDIKINWTALELSSP